MGSGISGIGTTGTGIGSDVKSMGATLAGISICSLQCDLADTNPMG